MQPQDWFRLDVEGALTPPDRVALERAHFKRSSQTLSDGEVVAEHFVGPAADEAEAQARVLEALGRSTLAGLRLTPRDALRFSPGQFERVFDRGQWPERDASGCYWRVHVDGDVVGWCSVPPRCERPDEVGLAHRLTSMAQKKDVLSLLRRPGGLKLQY